MNRTSNRTGIAITAGAAGGIIVGGIAAFSLTSGQEPPAPKTKAVAIAPQECADALDAAEQMIDLQSQVIQIASSTISDTMPVAIEAASTYDTAGILAATEAIKIDTESINDLSDEMAGVNYFDPSTACREAVR